MMKRYLFGRLAAHAWDYAGLCFFLVRKAAALRLAVWLADLKQRAFNRRFFVVLGPDERLWTVCNRDIKYMRRKGYLPKGFTSFELLEKAFYYTPAGRNNSDELTAEQRRQRRRIYLAYVRMRRYSRRDVKRNARERRRKCGRLPRG